MAWLRAALPALLLLWAGIVIGVSFLAAPAKFGAPSLTLPVALEVGREEFGVLNLVELVLLATGLALGALVRPARPVWGGLLLAGAIVLLQWLWLLPVLDARVETVIQGGTPPPAPWHTIYIVVECVKLLALLAAGWLALLTTSRSPPPVGGASR
jgi:hypothetical protein